MTLTCSDGKEEITISNNHFIAVISKNNGELVSVHYRKKDGKKGKQAVSSDYFKIQLTGEKQTIETTDLNAIKIVIEDNYDFYVKIAINIKLPSVKNDLYVKRIYEFSKNKNIYEQAGFYIKNVSRKGAVRKKSISIDKLEWIIETKTPKVNACRTADDLFVQQTDSPLGGLNSGLEGFKFKTDFSGSEPLHRPIVKNKLFIQNKKAAVIPEGRIFLVCSAIQIGMKGDNLIISKDYEQDQFQFYADYGTRAKGWKRREQKMFTFTNWSNYLLNRFVPITHPNIEDFLIRTSVHLCKRMKKDGGWLKTPKWSINYPRGDIFTAHSRVFPYIIFLWAHLALKWNGKEFVHHPCDADFIYHQLQETYKFYLPKNPKNFHNTYGSKKAPYISYSAATKNGKAKGVLNTHAHALHFAWVMIGASKFFGDRKRTNEWEALVMKYHAGSKALFKKLYPHMKDGKKVSGFLRYSIDGFNYTMKTIHSYNSISYEGIAAGYIDSGEYEVEFIDAVERASQPYLDYNPWNDKINSCGDSPFKGLLCRALPLALTYIGDKLVSSQFIQSASIDEVLKYKKKQEFTHKDPKKYIIEGDGKAPRKYIKTNKIFTSEGVSGYWEEKEEDEIPEKYKFKIKVSSSKGKDTGHFTAYRIDNQIQIMTDFDHANITLTLPKKTNCVATYRDYDEKNVNWKDEVQISYLSAKTLTFNDVPRKRILSIHIRK